MFIATQKDLAPGTDIAFSLELADGQPMLRGLGVIRSRWTTADNHFERAGVVVSFVQLTTTSEVLHWRMLALRAEVLEAVGRLAPLAARAECSTSQLALAWCLRRPEVTSVIVGATSTRHVDENVAAAGLEIEPGLFEEMNRVLEPVLAATI